MIKGLRRPIPGHFAMTMFVLVAAYGAMHALGCGGAPEGVCATGAGGDCVDTPAPTTGPSSCPPTCPGPTTPPVVHAPVGPNPPENDPITRALVENQAAKALIAAAPPANLSANPQAGAATAGGVTPALSQQPGASNANPGAGISNVGPVANNGGGGGGGGGGGAFGFKPGNLTTPPSADGVDGATGSSGPDSSNTDGMYSGGGANGNGSGYGNANGIGFGMGGDGTDNSVTEIDMNGMGGKKGARGANGAIDDPADYFSRLSAKDNIFKVVERRYTKKSQQWVAEDLDKLRTKDLPTLKNAGGKPK